MVIPIHIPIGVKRVATVQGAVWKLVDCASCKVCYAYLLELEAKGEDHDLLFLDAAGSTERARAQAQQNLQQKSRNLVLPVPCPNCGIYQDDMARLLKENASINWRQIVGIAVLLLAFVPLAFNIPNIWVLTVVLALAGLTILTLGVIRALRFDPNAGDAEPRKTLGRECAIWGDDLAILLAKTPPATVVESTPQLSESQSSQE